MSVVIHTLDEIDILVLSDSEAPPGHSLPYAWKLKKMPRGRLIGARCDSDSDDAMILCQWMVVPNQRRLGRTGALSRWGVS